MCSDLVFTPAPAYLAPNKITPNENTSVCPATFPSYNATCWAENAYRENCLDMTNRTEFKKCVDTVAAQNIPSYCTPNMMSTVPSCGCHYNRAISYCINGPCGVNGQPAVQFSSSCLAPFGYDLPQSCPENLTITDLSKTFPVIVY